MCPFVESLPNGNTASLLLRGAAGYHSQKNEEIEKDRNPKGAQNQDTDMLTESDKAVKTTGQRWLLLW